MLPSGTKTYHINTIAKYLCLNPFTLQRLIGLKYMDKEYLKNLWDDIKNYACELQVQRKDFSELNYKYSSVLGIFRDRCDTLSFYNALKAIRQFVAIEYNLDLSGLRVEMTPL